MFTKNHPVTGFTHLGDVIQRPRWLQQWESLRHGSLHWLIECIGEAFGVYFYVYLGVGANAAFNIGSITSQAGIGSLQTVALGYGLGIVMAVAIAGPASGGHFNPCVTIAHAVWHGFPWRKVPQFIIFQILGAYVACLVIYGQYHSTLLLLEESLHAVGKYDTVQFTPNGVAGIFALYTLPGANLRDVFMNEFFADFFLALIIWGIMDPTNLFVPPPAAPWVVGFAYSAIIWAFAPGALSANTARDLGGRFMALTIWGKSATGGKYAAIAAITNIPATLLATLVYELIFVDSSRVLPSAQQEFLNGHLAHGNHKTMGADQPRIITDGSNSSDEKQEFREISHVA